MRKWILFFGLFSFIVVPFLVVKAQEGDQGLISLTSPSGGEAIRGLFPVTGTTSINNFRNAELLFRYHGDRTGTWFLIYESAEAVTDDIIYQWDTTTITDGDYDLSLLVTRKNNKQEQTIIQGIRVRNYSPIETSTPGPTVTDAANTDLPVQTPVLEATQTDALTVAITPTPIPPNEIIITETDLRDSLLRGVAGVFAVTIIFGLYTTIRNRNQ